MLQRNDGAIQQRALRDIKKARQVRCGHLC